MTIMTENIGGEIACVMAAEAARCRKDSECDGGAAPCGERSNSSPRDRDDVPDQLADRRKKRRRKTKRKAPYAKAPVENKGRKVVRYASNESRYKQPEAPYNSNRFLIEDHNDLKDIDVDLLATANRINGDNVQVQKSPQRTRARDSSFTSVESDDDFYYSSPEDEEEFLTKEFSNTYKDLHVETLAGLSKTELIQHILSLEERMDMTQKKLESLSRTKTDSSSMSDKVVYFQEEISKLVIANRTLLRENERLRRQRNGCSGSSEDSESDSSSSTSCSSTTSASDKEQTLLNGDSSLDPLMDTENVT